MPSKYYVVEKGGVPAVWQADPRKILRMLKNKVGFTILSVAPSDTRADALITLRQLFPGCRPIKSS